MSSSPFEVLVVGGGLAGSAAAIRLARAGRRVALLESAHQPKHKVCGEFLSQEALGYLHQLGIDAEVLGAVPIHTVRFQGVAQALPFAAMSLTRRALDEELLRLAASEGATVLRGSHVEALERSGDGWQALLKDGSPVSADTVFLATGKHNLRGRPRPASKQNDLVALKMYFRLAPEQSAALAGTVELALYGGGYAGLQPVENDTANLCCLIQRSVFSRIGGSWPDLLAAMQTQCPLLRTRLAGARALLPKPLALAAIPYGFLREKAEDGLWSLGDQASVIPSFTGDGMSIALHSGSLAAAMYLEGSTSAAFQKRLHGELAGQVRFATTLSRALIWPPSRHVATAAVRLWPGLLTLIAKQTRVAGTVLLRHPVAAKAYAETGGTSPIRSI